MNPIQRSDISDQQAGRHMAMVPPRHSAKEKSGAAFDARAAVVSKLLHNIAHDIRTPATAVRGYLRLLLDGRAGAITPDQRECLEIALKSAEQLAAFGATVDEASEILERMNAETLDLRDLWSLACNAYGPRILAGQFLIKERIPADRVPVNGDRSALTTILEGVLAHALEGVAAGSEVHVDLRRTDSDSTLKLELPRSPRNEEEARMASFLKLRNSLFLQGGTLTLGKTGEHAVFTISLPGYSI